MPKRSPPPQEPDVDFPKYSITVVAALTGVHPQQLRRYEQNGLLVPHKSTGGTRRYSDADVARIWRIRQLLEAGINQSGIEQILSLQGQLRAAEERATLAETQLATRSTESQNAMAESADPDGTGE